MGMHLEALLKDLSGLMQAVVFGHGSGLDKILVRAGDLHVNKRPKP
jgi:hypothetical protein